MLDGGENPHFLFGFLTFGHIHMQCGSGCIVDSCRRGRPFLLLIMMMIIVLPLLLWQSVGVVFLLPLLLLLPSYPARCGHRQIAVSDSTTAGIP